MNRRLVQIFFFAVLATMLTVTVQASMQRGVFPALADLWPDPWFRATLADAYLGFLTVWLWVAWRERSWTRRLAWLVAFLLLGNFAMAAYALLQIRALEPGEPVGRILERKPAPAGSPG